MTFTLTYTSTATSTPTPLAVMSLQKKASVAMLRAGDVVRYDLILHVSGSSASAVTLTDMLPNGLIPSTVVFVSGPVGTVNGQTLTWVLGTTAPGDVDVSFTVQVDPLTQGESILTNTAQATSPSALPVDASVSLKVKGDIQVVIGVYNEAGELVRTFPVMYLSNPVGSMDVTGNGVLTSVGSSVTLTWDGGRVLGSWDGTGQDGQLVANGSSN
jgi:uncharacterized repeat protein (TIGR01451 family)